MQTTAVRLGVLGVALVAPLFVCSEAEAMSYTHVDARHDVMVTSSGDRAPGNRKADVSRVQVTHSRSKVVLRIRLRSSSLKGLKFRTIGFGVITPKARFSGDFILRRKAAQEDLWNDTTGHAVSCAESTGQVRNTIRVTLDRTCFDSPRWVRTAITVGTNDGDSAWADNALSPRWRRANAETYSPRVFSS